jgi:uncharacterized protein (DUF2267 family)
MKEHEFVAAVRSGAELPTHERAEQIAKATLGVLGQRLTAGESSDVASQLPPGLAEVMPASGTGERFGVEEFYHRVARAEGDGADEQKARGHARAVMGALKTGLTAGEYHDLLAQLPDDYGDLVGTGVT